MALTVDKLLGDARLLVTRLKDQDTSTDTIISTSQILHKRIEAMKQYQDDINELNEMAKHRPRSTLVMGLAQENQQIRDLQQEKQELQIALEEHQSALQLIMHKYRQHTVNLLRANHLDGRAAQHQGRSKEEVCRLLDKVEEMAGVMQHAVRLDDQHDNQTQELVARLELENRTLRQMLEVCTTAHLPILPPAEEDEASLDLSHHNASSLDSSCSSQVSQIEVKLGATTLGPMVEDSETRPEEGEGKEEEDGEKKS
ncbi:FGFR1 oncogene partner 2 homolog [Babylonia areolata]|uniref:FGFR1 oncogene partner 2 homolog n=1 Tax=Babylonia areolata TaxID=304850 RepID=UPI003FD44C88